MPRVYDDWESGDSFASGRNIKINGEAFDPSNPLHQAALRDLSGRHTSDDDTEPDDDDDNTTVVSASSPDGEVTTTIGQHGQPASVRLPNGGTVTAGGTVYSSDGDMVIIRRKS